MTENQRFQVNQEIQATVDDLSSRGSGVVKVEGYPFFVEGVLPGESIRFKVTKVGRKFGNGELIEQLTISPNRVELTDPIGQEIGTMSLQHLSYDAQLKYKQDQVKQAFQRIGHFENIPVQGTLGMEYPWGYRNKAQIPVRLIEGKLETGFYRRGSHDLVPVENYHIQDPEIDRVILIVRDILREFNIEPYNEESHKGIIRHIIVRRGHYTGEVMIILVTNGDILPHRKGITQRLVEEVPEMVSLMQNIQSHRSNVILGRTNRQLWGRDYYEDQMLGLTFRISTQSFYQVNTPQAEVLYQTAIDVAGISEADTVLDAYCGIGSISLALAKQAKKVYAMEIVPEAIEMAKQNAKLNNLTNTHFEAGAAEKVLPKWQKEGIQFDVAVVDPPRKGLDESFIHTLIEQAPERIVYVSCNPATQARDCRVFVDGGYEIKSVQPVDLFPQTTHVEAVVLMQKVKE